MLGIAGSHNQQHQSLSEDNSDPVMIPFLHSNAPQKRKRIFSKLCKFKEHVCLEHSGSSNDDMYSFLCLCSPLLWTAGAQQASSSSFHTSCTPITSKADCMETGYFCCSGLPTKAISSILLTSALYGPVLAQYIWCCYTNHHVHCWSSHSKIMLRTRQCSLLISKSPCLKLAHVDSWHDTQEIFGSTQQTCIWHQPTGWPLDAAGALCYSSWKWELQVVLCSLESFLHTSFHCIVAPYLWCPWL